MTNAEFYLHDLASKFKKIDPKKYYLAYSGGKDSGMLFWFLREWLKKEIDSASYELDHIPNKVLDFRCDSDFRRDLLIITARH